MYDVKCEALAREFLEDHAAVLMTHGGIARVAQAIQTAIEDTIEELRAEVSED